MSETPTIADKFVNARGLTNPSVKHLVTNEAFLYYVEKGASLTALCGRPVEFDEPVEPSRTCSRCLGKATGRQKRGLTRHVTKR